MLQFLPNYMRDVLEFAPTKNGILSALPILFLLISKTLSSSLSSWFSANTDYNSTTICKTFNGIASLVYPCPSWLSPSLKRRMLTGHYITVLCYDFCRPAYPRCSNSPATAGSSPLRDHHWNCIFCDLNECFIQKEHKKEFGTHRSVFQSYVSDFVWRRKFAGNDIILYRPRLRQIAGLGRAGLGSVTMVDHDFDSDQAV
uniref:Uncharacterized protein n=1 Tax=Ditylenchus dipsaci TaxID=166011 RepID=A0A915EQQ0_9BILA